MALALTALLAILTFAFVGYPLLRPRRAEFTTDPAAEALEELMVKRDAALVAIKELEFDYESGNLSEEDYQEMEERYRERAIAILKDIDLWQAGETAEDVIERQVAALRQAQDNALRTPKADQDNALRQAQDNALRQAPAEGSGQAQLEDTIERQVQEIRQGHRGPVPPTEAPLAIFCFNCGARRREGARFCPSCGASLMARHCSQCGASLEPEDRFCAHCGTPAPDGG